MAEFGIHAYHRAEKPRVDLVLVHGLLGDSRGTWTGEDSDKQPTYWPDWIKQVRPDVNIWLADYDSSLNAWLQPATPLDQIAASLLAHAHDQGLGARPIHWVGHSMGGLVIKYILCNARNDDYWRAIAQADTAVTFLGTPHHGADVANWKSYFSNFLQAADLLLQGGFWNSAARLLDRVREAVDGQKRQSHIEQLTKHNSDLAKLNNHFALWMQEADKHRRLVSIRNYMESLPVKGVVTVVPDASARLSIGIAKDLSVQANHFTICKFSKGVGNMVFDSIVAAIDRLSERYSPSNFSSDENVAVFSGRNLIENAWQKSLSECSVKVIQLVCEELKRILVSRITELHELKGALSQAFIAKNPSEIIVEIRYRLGYPVTGYCTLSQDECRQRSTLYLLLLARAVELWRQADLRKKAVSGLVVPESDDSKHLAIAIAAHLVSGQGLLLRVEPGGVRPDNLLEMAALPDEYARPPGQLPSATPMEQEVRRWLARVLANPQSCTTFDVLKPYLDRFEEDNHARPILLDREGMMHEPAVRQQANQLGIGIVSIAGKGRPSTISSLEWDEFCGHIDLKGLDLGRDLSSREERDIQSLSSASTINVNVNTTGPIGQSNITTGSNSPISAQYAASPSSEQENSVLTAAWLGLILHTRDRPDLTPSLHALRAVIIQRNLSSNAQEVIASALPKLRMAAQSEPAINEALDRLRRVVHAYWPDSVNFF